MSKTLFMMKGLPASGKSTKAKQMLKDFGSGNAKRVSKDDLRAMLDNGEWSGQNEKFLLGVRDYIVSNGLNAGKHVIVDDTNLVSKHEIRLRDLAKSADAAFEVVDFLHVSLEECVERDRKRSNYVGEQVIRGMHRDLIAPKPPVAKHDPELADIVICDVDGTVAQMHERGPFEWAKVGQDLPRKAVIRAVTRQGYPVVFMSGRDECCRQETEEWLGEYFSEVNLHMRPAGDMRKDTVVKRELYEEHILGRFNVMAIFDDRPQVISLWQELGFGDRIFNVGDGREF